MLFTAAERSGHQKVEFQAQMLSCWGRTWHVWALSRNPGVRGETDCRHRGEEVGKARGGPRVVALALSKDSRAKVEQDDREMADPKRLGRSARG